MLLALYLLFWTLLAPVLPGTPATLAPDALVLKPIPQTEVPMVWCYNLAYGRPSTSTLPNALYAQEREVCNYDATTPREPPLWLLVSRDAATGYLGEITGYDFDNRQMVLLYTHVYTESNVLSNWFWRADDGSHLKNISPFDATLHGTAQPYLTWREEPDWQLLATINWIGHGTRDYMWVWPEWVYQYKRLYLPMLVH